MSEGGVFMTTIEHVNEKKRVQVQVDRQLAEQVEHILDAIGLTPTTALTVFYKQIVNHGGIPFALEASERDKATAKLMAATRKQPVTRMNKEQFEAWLEEDEY